VLKSYFKQANEPNKLLALDEFLSKNLSYDLFAHIDDAKIALSNAETANINFSVPPHITLNEEISRTDFEYLIYEYVDSARELISEALKQAGVTPGDINRVICVGGSSQIPAFKAMLDEIFPDRVSSGDIFTSISAGLISAYEAGLALDI
jgi:hypothetical chaperone protein